MKLLLDTHVLLWVLAGSERLPAQARLLIEKPDNTVYYSIVSPWEVQIKHLNHPDKLDYDAKTVERFCRVSGFIQLPVKTAHISYLAFLQRAEHAPPHKDPFGRIMVCQAVKEDMLFITHDEGIAGYVEPCILKV